MLVFALALIGFSHPAVAFDAAELEEARDNARAGGPVSEHGTEYLVRYGCFSGTNTLFCRRLENRWGHQEQRKHRR